jgi:hypothetical protein
LTDLGEDENGDLLAGGLGVLCSSATLKLSTLEFSTFELSTFEFSTFEADLLICQTIMWLSWSWSEPSSTFRVSKNKFLN